MPERSRRPVLWLLLLPYLGLLWVPFFYWYQFAWVPLTALIIWIAYRSVRHDD